MGTPDSISHNNNNNFETNNNDGGGGGRSSIISLSGTKSTSYKTTANGNGTANGGTASRRTSRMSISGDLPPGTRMRQRRKAVEISDQRACVLLHSRLKGMKLEDIA